MRWWVIFLAVASATERQLPLQHSQTPILSSRIGIQSTFDVTLATQLSMDRMWLLPGLCSRWDGHTVAAIYVPIGSYHIFNKRSLKLRRLFPQTLRIIHHKAHQDETLSAYPVNLMRNLAFSAVKTSHSFMVDVDMWPSFQLRHFLVGALNTPELAQDNRTVIVVPPFSLWARHTVEWGSRVVVKSVAEGLAYNNRLPGTFTDLANCFMPLRHKNLDPRLCSVFQGVQDSKEATVCCADTCLECGHCHHESPECCRKHILRSNASCSDDTSAPCARRRVQRLKEERCSVFDHGNVGAHSSMGLPEWWGQAPGSLRKISCINSARFEPYVVIRTAVAQAMQYNEELKGYGKNKIEFIQRLWLDNNIFYVIGQGFIFHHPHPESPSAKIWRNHGNFTDSSMKNKNDALFAYEMNDVIAGVLAPLTTPCCDRMLLSNVTVEAPPSWC